MGRGADSRYNRGMKKQPGTPERRSGPDRSILHTIADDHEVALDEKVLRRMAESALLEDRAWHDITTDALVPEEQRGRARIVAKEAGVIAGLPVAQTVFAAADTTLVWTASVQDGARVSPGDLVSTIEGSLASIMRGERVALNYLGHLSGVATATAKAVEAVRGTDCRIRDTRKTIPGLRSLQKYAVRMGGGTNHRADLASGVLIKDNHLDALRSRGFGIAEAVSLAAKANPHVRIEVEVTDLREAREAMEAGAHELLLDNMTPAAMREVVEMVAEREHRPALEASGGITLENAREVAETGVDYISLGALTHSARALDLSLRLEM